MLDYLRLIQGSLLYSHTEIFKKISGSIPWETLFLLGIYLLKEHKEFQINLLRTVESRGLSYFRPMLF